MTLCHLARDPCGKLNHDESLCHNGIFEYPEQVLQTLLWFHDDLEQLSL